MTRKSGSLRKEFQIPADYDTEVRVHKGNLAKLIEETVRKREQDLERSAATHQSQKNKRTRCVGKFENDSDEQEDEKSKSGGKRRTGDSPHGKPIPHIPFIPKLLFMSLDVNTRKNLITWRKMTNQGETMEKKDLVSSEDDKGAKMHKTEKKKGCKAPRLVTKTRRVGIQDDMVEIKLASSDSEYSTILTCPDFESREPIVTIGDDSNFESKSDHSIKSGAEGTSTRIQMLKRAASVGMSKSQIRHPPYAVIDPGAKREVIGGVGWQILHFFDKSESLSGALAGMGSESLPSVDAVTSAKDTEGRTVLLGIGDAAYDRRTTQHEALWNSHHLRSNNVQVSDVAAELGGDQQCIRVKDHNRNWITIPLKFNGDIMTLDINEPTKEELLALRVNRLTSPMEKITPQSIG